MRASFQILRKLRGSALCLCALICASALPLRASTLNDAVEDKIKAAYLYNFTKFIEWPPAAFQGTSAPFVVGVIDPGGEMYRVITETLRAKTTPSGHPIEVRRLSADEPGVGEVQLLFVAREAEVDPRSLRSAIATQPLLLVGETEEFAAHGGAIGLLVAGDAVRFEVNLAAAQRAGLKLSGRLASVAHLVREQPSP